jgi:hypothetical protein
MVTIGRRDQALHVLSELGVSRAPACHFLLRGCQALVPHLAPVEAHAAMVNCRTVLSSGTELEAVSFTDWVRAYWQHVNRASAARSFSCGRVASIPAPCADQSEPPRLLSSAVLAGSPASGLRLLGLVIQIRPHLVVGHSFSRYG